MPTIGRLHHHKPGTEAGRWACSEQRSLCLSVPTTNALFAGEVQSKAPAFRAVASVCEVRIRSAQPPSRGLFGSLPTFTRRSRRSPEMRHQLAVVLSDLTPESAPGRDHAASIPFYLFWQGSAGAVKIAHRLGTVRLENSCSAIADEEDSVWLFLEVRCLVG